MTNEIQDTVQGKEKELIKGLITIAVIFIAGLIIGLIIWG